MPPSSGMNMRRLDNGGRRSVGAIICSVFRKRRGGNRVPPSSGMNMRRLDNGGRRSVGAGTGGGNRVPPSRGAP